SLLFRIRELLNTGSDTGLWIYLGGLLLFVVSFVLVAWLAEQRGRGKSTSWQSAIRGFAPTVLPIAGAYEIAHNYPWILGNTGRF
ncbi:MAG: hypothetical protein ABEH64_13950, partial [Salinirussus sp.]